MSKLKILITGATGFIGTSLLHHLLPQKHELYIVSRKNIKNLHNINIIEANLLHKNFTTTLPKHIDIVLHLAQSKLYKKDLEEAEDIFDINVLSTFKLLEWAKQSNVKKFIYMSSGSVYSSSLEKKHFTEEDPTVTSNIYSASKIASENLLLAYQKLFSTYILRLFTPYGPGQSKDFFIPQIINNIENNHTITLAGETGPYFTPLYITDICNILTILVKSTKIKNTILNLSGSETLNLKNIATIISNQLKTTPVIKNINNSPVYVCGANKKLVELTNYKFTDFSTGISNTINANLSR